MVKRSVVRLDDSRFTSTDIYSVRLNDDAENGFVVKLGDVETDNLDVRKAETPAAEDSIVLIANPAIVYDNARMGSGLETNYFMKEGEVVRAYAPKATFLFSLSEEGINGTAVKGEYLVTGAGNKLVPSPTIPASGFAGKVVDFETVGGRISLLAEHSPVKYAIIETVQN